MSGKPKGSKESYALLTAEFAATVDESHRGYRLWYSNGGWARLPVSKVQQVQEDWDPLEAGVSTFLFGSSRKGVLTDTLTIATDQATASFAKGASVQFASLWNNDERGFVDIVAANLAKDVSKTTNEWRQQTTYCSMHRKIRRQQTINRPRHARKSSYYIFPSYGHVLP